MGPLQVSGARQTDNLLPVASTIYGSLYIELRHAHACLYIR